MKRIILLGVLAIILLVGAVFVWPDRPIDRPNIIDVADWKIFRNSEFGYEINYPSGAELKNPVGGSFVDIFLESHLGIPKDMVNEKIRVMGGGLDFVVLIESKNVENSKNLPVREWVYENIFTGYRSSEPGSVERDTILAGTPAYYTEYDYLGSNGLYSYTRFQIYALHRDRLYQISGVKLPRSPTPAWLAHPYYQYLERSIPISEAILNSFKFTD